MQTPAGGGLKGSKRLVKCLAGIFVISLGIKTGSHRGQKQLIVTSCKSSGFIIPYVDRLHILLRVPPTLIVLPQLTLSQIVEYLAKSPATYTSPAYQHRSLLRFAGLQPTSVMQPLVHEALGEA